MLGGGKLSQVLNRYMNKNIKVVIKFSNGPIIYRGKLVEVNDKFIVLNDFKMGEIVINSDDISTVFEDDRRGEK